MIRKHALAIIIFLAVSATLFIRSIYFDNVLSSDQTFFQLIYLGKTNPLFSDYRVPALDAYIPFQITNFLRGIISDPIWVYRTILPFLSFTYLLCFYIILKRIRLSSVVSIIVPLISLIPRTAMGSQYWGIIALGNATHRAFIQPFFPIFFYAVYRYRDHISILSFLFFGLGIISALYPTQAFYFTLILLFALFINSPQKIHFTQKGALLGGAFILGTLHYIIPNLTVGLNIDLLSDDMIQQFNEALRYRFSYTFYPESLLTYTRRILLDSALLWFIYIFTKKIKSRIFLDNEQKSFFLFAEKFLLATLLVTFVVPLLQDIISTVFHTRLLIFDQFGELKFMYLTLFIALAFFLEYIIRISFDFPYKTVFMGSIVMSFLIIGNFFILGDLIAKFYPLDQFTPNSRSFQKTCQWIKRETKNDTILITSDFNFRLCSNRRLFATWKEGMVYLYKSPAEFVSWYQRLRSQETAFMERDIDKLFNLAPQPVLIIIKKSEWDTPLKKENVRFENREYALISKSNPVSFD